MSRARIIEVFIILTIAVISVFVIRGIYHYTVVKPNLYTISFPDIDSIIKGSPVRFMGIIVGHVRNLERVEDKILCEIVVTKPNTKIPDGAVAKVEYNGLGGSKSIEIMPPKTDNPDVNGIVAAQALRISDFAEVFDDLREVLACVKQFVDGITPESTLGAAKAIAEAPDFTEDANKTLDEMLEKQKKSAKTFRNIKGFELQIEKLIDRIKFR